MKKRFALLIWLSILLLHHQASATHNRAGEITFNYRGGFDYEITITTYTNSNAPVDRPFLNSVYFGDGDTATFIRINGGGNGVLLPNSVRYNIYKLNNPTHFHTYPGSGTYDIYFIDPDRNAGVINIPNSVNVPFAVHATLNINPNFAGDNSPVLLNPPIDQGCVGVPFIHNPAAYDPDGDSLSFQLVVCRGDGNLPIPGYTFPLTTNTFSLDPVTGELVWNAPPATGNYVPPYEVNVAFEVYEWRRIPLITGPYHMIGVVERDMQITIHTCNNNPPQIQSLQDTCVLANDSIGLLVNAVDPDHDLVKLTASGGPLDQVSPPMAQFSTNPAVEFTSDSVTGLFTWTPSCSHVRLQPYQVLFRAQDSIPYLDTTFVSLANLKSLFITVIAPAPTNLTATPSGNAMQLHWDPDICSQARGYKIYHRAGSYPGTIQCPCETGVPAYTGYSLIGSVSGLNNTNFTDNNNGQGLAIGVLHCYLVVAVFPDGSESCASNQACEHLKKELPVITNVSVDTTNGFEDVNGAIYIAWSKPNELDTVQYPGPYQYRLYRSSNGNSPTLIATIPSPFLNDTTYYDEPLTTAINAYSYYIELYYDSSGVQTLKGKSSTASSVYLRLTPTDRKIILNWEEYAPWGNYRYVIYRLNTITSLYDSIAEVNFGTYITNHACTDSNLVNGTQYCYNVKSVGSYNTPGIKDTLENFSQKICAVPVDNVPPCPPKLTVIPDCPTEANQLTWTNPYITCGDSDVAKYYVWFSPDSTHHEFIIIDTIFDKNQTTVTYAPLTSLSGCYKVTAVDSAGNQSTTNVYCVDTCREYILPSVFTPNGDGVNDLFHPCDSTTSEQLQKKNCPPYKNVRDIDIKIYDRWGLIVFETTDKNINWDGKNQKSKSDCPDGVYYYTCRVNFFRIVGTETIELKGYVHLLRGKE